MPFVQRQRSRVKVGYKDQEWISIPSLTARYADKYSTVKNNLFSRYFESKSGQGSRWLIIQTDDGVVDDDWYAISQDFRIDQAATIEGDSLNETLVNIQKFIDKTPADYNDKLPSPPRFYKDRFGEFWVLGRNGSGQQALTGAYGGVLIEFTAAPGTFGGVPLEKVGGENDTRYLTQAINVWVGKQPAPSPPNPSLGLGYEIGSATTLIGPPKAEETGSALAGEKKEPVAIDEATTLDPIVITAEDKEEKPLYVQKPPSTNKAGETPWLAIALGGAALAGGYYFYSRKKQP